MFLSGVLFVLFLAGCWLYCLTDAAVTPAVEFPGLRKPAWMAVIALTFIFGAIAWLIARRAWRGRYWPPAAAAHPMLADRYYATETDEFGGYPNTAAEALARHPASRSKNAPERARPIGPDDDPEFLRELAERIRGDQ